MSKGDWPSHAAESVRGWQRAHGGSVDEGEVVLDVGPHACNGHGVGPELEGRLQVLLRRRHVSELGGALRAIEERKSAAHRRQGGG